MAGPSTHAVQQCVSALQSDSDDGRKQRTSCDIGGAQGHAQGTQGPCTYPVTNPIRVVGYHPTKTTRAAAAARPYQGPLVF